MCEGGAMVEFCQTKMETRSCKYGFICWCIFGYFLAGKVRLLSPKGIKKGSL